MRICLLISNERQNLTMNLQNLQRRKTRMHPANVATILGCMTTAALAADPEIPPAEGTASSETGPPPEATETAPPKTAGGRSCGSSCMNGPQPVMGFFILERWVAGPGYS